MFKKLLDAEKEVNVLIENASTLKRAIEFLKSNISLNEEEREVVDEVEEEQWLLEKVADDFNKNISKYYEINILEGSSNLNTL